MLELKNISFSVEDETNKKQKEILNNISLTVDEDSFVVIIGCNTSSTIMNFLKLVKFIVDIFCSFTCYVSLLYLVTI